jgi:dihydrofolate synthase/folylpolyglutamate synthase
MHAVTNTAETDLRRYVAAVRALLERGGYERTGRPEEAKRWGLDHIRAYLDANSSPEVRATVHIAGTKGKGSTAAMVESILRHAGAHTLLETSPDLQQARERIAIDGAPIAEATFAAIAERLLADPATEGWSYFELLTVMGWLAAAEAACDWQVLEVGLGGRLDTTNAVREKAVAIVTPIDLEHTAILGDTIPEIAAEKAAIVEGARFAVAAPMRASALDVVRAAAADAGVELVEVAEHTAMRARPTGLDGQRIDLQTPLRTYRQLRLPLLGPHQAENAAAAVLAAELAWRTRGAPAEAAATEDDELPEAAVRDGLERVRLHGRLEVLRRDPLVIVDAAHTPLAARRIREALAQLALPRHRITVLGVLDGKDLDGLAAALAEEGDEVIVAPPRSQRAAEPRDVARALRERRALAQLAPDVPTAVERAIEQVGERGMVLVTGSLVTVAEARAALLGVTDDAELGAR